MAGDKYDWQIGGNPPLLDDHSLAKHDVLRRYVAKYVEVLTANPFMDGFRLTLVDGFAGGGLYQHGGIVVPGSPLILLDEIAASEARANINRTKAIKIDSNFVFVEKKRPAYEYLNQALHNSAHKNLLGDRVNVVHGNFETVLPNILDRIRSRGTAHRAIFFLDQYGYTDFSLQTVRKIIEELANPEVILTFNVDYLIDYLSSNDSFVKAASRVGLSRADVLHMLGLKEQREARWLIQNFLYQHLIAQTGAPYYTPFFVVSTESHRAYWLVHISKHPKARDEMAVLHWELQNHFIHHGRAGLRMLGFDPDKPAGQVPMDFLFDDDAGARSMAALIDELPREIFRTRSLSEAAPTLKSLFTGICNETPATTHLVSSTLLQLRGMKEIEILGKDGKVKPRAQKVEWDDVILPARQRDMFSPIVVPKQSDGGDDSNDKV
jgi:three-Cys-motif partner protein